MIEQLTVQDYILFDQAQIDFDQNMSVITGETGAGKSLLIDAIQAISGGRIGKGVVRKGKDKAILQMVLSNPSKEVCQMLEENGFDVEDTIIITRIVSASGKSRMLLNSRTTTNSFVAKIVSRMVDIHSQMDTIRLMDPALQLEMLDRFAKNEERMAQTRAAYSRLRAVSAKIRKLKNETFSQDRLDYLTTRLNAIQNAKIKEGELEALEQKIAKAEQIQDAFDSMSEALYLYRKEGGIQDLLVEAAGCLKNHQTEEEFGTRLTDLAFEVQDLFERVSDVKNETMMQEGHLDKMQERLFLIKDLFRENGGTYESMTKAAKDMEEQIDQILHRQDVFDRLEKERRHAMSEYTKQASLLHQARKAVVPALKELVEKHARDLMLEHCVFDIHFDKKQPSSDGMDAVEFYASMNPGQAPSPLKASASGGELSRLMLALKVVFQAEDGIGTLVFDEIDTGVSGKVALAMGSKMHALAKDYQVLCITHLPSVAVWADDHYCVSKSTDGTITTTQVSELSQEDHFKELAIMASGNADEAGVSSMKELARRVRHG